MARHMLRGLLHSFREEALNCVDLEDRILYVSYRCMGKLRERRSLRFVKMRKVA